MKCWSKRFHDAFETLLKLLPCLEKGPITVNRLYRLIKQQKGLKLLGAAISLFITWLPMLDKNLRNCFEENLEEN